MLLKDLWKPVYTASYIADISKMPYDLKHLQMMGHQNKNCCNLKRNNQTSTVLEKIATRLKAIYGTIANYLCSRKS